MNTLDIKLSTVVCVHNEAGQLADCLKTLSFADEIIVVLDRCTDDSKTISLEFGATITEGDWPLEGPRRHAGIDIASNTWILEIDADERVGETLAQEILKTIQTAEPGYFLVPFNNYVGDRLIRHGWGGSWGVMAAPRLYTRGAKIWGNAYIHPPLTLEGSKRKLKNSLTHYVDEDFNDMIQRLWRYSNYRAQDLRSGNTNMPSLLSTLRRCCSRFIKCYLFRKGYKEGLWGFTIALMAALYPLISHLIANLDSIKASNKKNGFPS